MYIHNTLVIRIYVAVPNVGIPTIYILYMYLMLNIAILYLDTK